MGSPISSFFADIVMDNLESDCLKKLKLEHNCKPIFYFHYVDDIILCIHEDLIDIVVNTFNSYHTKLKFTYELQENNLINYLGISIINKNRKLLIIVIKNHLSLADLSISFQVIHHNKK